MTVCNIITPEIKKLAKTLSLTEADALNRVNLYMSAMSTYEVPSAKELKDFIDTQRNPKTSTYNTNSIYYEHQCVYTGSRDTRLANKLELSSKEVLDIIADNKDYSSIVKLLKYINKDTERSLLDSFTVKVAHTPSRLQKLQPKNDRQRRAAYDADENTIYIDPTGDYINGDSASVLLHEVMHAVTVDAIANSKTAKEAFTEIYNSYIEQYKNTYGRNTLKYSGEHAIEEFIADIWSDPDTIENLKNFKYEGTISLWNKFKDFFRNLFTSLFGEELDNSLFAKASDELIALLYDQTAITNLATGTYYETSQSTEKKTPKYQMTTDSINNDTAAVRYATSFNSVEKSNRVQLVSKTTSRVLTKLRKEAINSLIKEQIELREQLDTVTYDKKKRSEVLAKLSIVNKDLKEYNNENTWKIKVLNCKDVYNAVLKEFKEVAELSAEDLIDEFETIEEAQHYIDAYKKIIDNFELLFRDSMVFTSKRENLRINMYNSTVKAAEEEETTSDFEDDPNGDSIASSDSLIFKARTTDPFTTSSAITKSILNSVFKVDNNGKETADDLGNILYYTGEYLHAVLVNEFKDMISPDDFCIKNEEGNRIFPAFQKNLTKYPWVKQLEQLLNTDQKVSTFYSDLRNDFISYWMHEEHRNDVTKVMAMNKENAINSVMNKVKSNYDNSIELEGEDSLYKEGKPTDKGIEKGKELVTTTLNYLNNKTLDEDTYNTIVNNIYKMLRMVDIETTIPAIKNLIGQQNGIIDTIDVVTNLSKIFTGAKYLKNQHAIKEFDGYYNRIASKIGIVNELDNIQVIRQGDKSYYSYSKPNYVDTMLKKLANKDTNRRNAYIENRFKKYEWFYNHTTGTWRSGLLDMIENSELVRDNLETMHLIATKTWDGKNHYYRDWSPYLVMKNNIVQYFAAGTNKANSMQFAWYSTPILGDSPVMKFIKLPRFIDDFKNEITIRLREVVKQELHRMALINARRNSGATKIANFDDFGNSFYFIPELNDIKDFVSTASKFIKDKNIDGFNKHIDSTIKTIMDNKFNTYWEYNASELNGIRPELGSTVASNEKELKNAIEEYYWNDFYAKSQIIQLTTTDLAFYKPVWKDGGVDFQKRYKEIYASGPKLFTNSKYGRKTEKTVYVRDIKRTSSEYTNIETALSRAVEQGNLTNTQKEEILAAFRSINVADAQAFRTLGSFRAILDMLGKWDDDKMQATFDRFERGDWNKDDFDTVWNTIKPFVFSNIEKLTGIDTTTYPNMESSMLVPHQNKNSEFLLIAIGSLIGYSLNKSSELRGLQRFMESNNIDVVQFESAVKAGAQGVVDISYSQPKLDKVIEFLKKQEKGDFFKTNFKEGIIDIDTFKKVLDEALVENKINQDTYNTAFEKVRPSEEEVINMLTKATKLADGSFNPEYVHEIDYDDYMIAQPTPAHLVDAQAIFGSQFRNLIESDLPDDFKVTIQGRTFTKKEIKALYKNLIIENLLDNFEELKKGFDNIEAFQERLLGIIEGNPKYGKEIRDALKIETVTDPTTGAIKKQFAIPLNMPSITLKLQEIVNSMFKNSIQKQHIGGGAAILVSSVGNPELKCKHSEDGAIIEAECYLPAWSKVFLKHAIDKETGMLDINKIPENLRKMIAYRIPTEHKYSMLPLKVVGFLPSSCGSVIMLPNETITNSGEDFDVDKKFLMIPQFTVTHLKKSELIRDFKKTEYGKTLSDRDIQLAVDMFEDGTLNQTSEAYLEILILLGEDEAKYGKTELKKIEYDFSKNPEELLTDNMTDAEKRKARIARNNALIDISTAILTHPDIASQVHHAGNFDNVRRMANISTLMHNPSVITSLKEQYGDDATITKEVLKLSNDELKEQLSKYKWIHNPCEPGTYEYFHEQVMTGDALIGIYANNTVSQAKYQGTNLTLKPKYRFTINGKYIDSLSDIKVKKTRGSDNIFISNNCAEFSAASVDNGKDPTLAALMQNKNTAGVTGAMLKAGLSIEEIGLLWLNYSSDAVTLKWLTNFAKKELKIKVPDTSIIKKEDFTSEELLQAFLEGYKLEELFKNETPGNLSQEFLNMIHRQFRVHYLIAMFDTLAEKVTNPITRISRADSPNGALATSIAGGEIQRRNVEILHRQGNAELLAIENVDDVIKNNIITPNMDRNTIRTTLREQALPTIQAFYSLGIEIAPKLYTKYFPQTSKVFKAYSDYLQDLMFLGIAPSKKKHPNSVTLDVLYNDMVTYALAGTKLFGDDDTMTYEEKRDYYIYEYPRVFLEKRGAPSFINNGAIQQLIIQNGRIQMSPGKQSPSVRDSIRDGLDGLLNTNDPEALHMLEDLLKYSYYVEQLNFGPNSIGNYISPLVLQKFPELLDTLRNITTYFTSKEVANNFFDQFFAQRSNAVAKVFIDSKKDFEAGLLVGKFTNPDSLVDPDYVYVKEGDNDFGLYKKVRAGKEKDAYKPFFNYGIIDTVRYNPNSTAEEIAMHPVDRKRYEELVGMQEAPKETLGNDTLKLASMEEAASIQSTGIPASNGVTFDPERDYSDFEQLDGAIPSSTNTTEPSNVNMDDSTQKVRRALEDAGFGALMDEFEGNTTPNDYSSSESNAILAKKGEGICAAPEVAVD